MGRREKEHRCRYCGTTENLLKTTRICTSCNRDIAWVHTREVKADSSNITDKEQLSRDLGDLKEKIARINSLIAVVDEDGYLPVPSIYMKPLIRRREARK